MGGDVAYLHRSISALQLSGQIFGGRGSLRPLMIPPGKTTQMITPRHQGHIQVSRKDTRQDGSSRLPPMHAINHPSPRPPSFFKSTTRRSRESPRGPRPARTPRRRQYYCTASNHRRTHQSGGGGVGRGHDSFVSGGGVDGTTVRYHRRSQWKMAETKK